MDIAIIGYGKMGKEIERMALGRGHQIPLIIDVANAGDMTPENLSRAEVAIDFSIPGAAFDNIMHCFDADVPVVSGTTGWLDRYDAVAERCRRENKAFFYASNFSIGVNILFALNKHLARMMDHFGEYDMEIREVHHVHKLDAPSGTAITLAKDLISEVRRKDKWELDGAADKSTLKITAVRENEVPGIHTVAYRSEFDELSIMHSARSRKGFALGATMAAEFIRGKKGIYTMADLLGLE